MTDYDSGREMWRSGDWSKIDMFSTEIEEEIPKDILTCSCITREIVFSSMEELDEFRLEQKVYFEGVCIEAWAFTFGYVMGGSTNTWQQTIKAAPPHEMMSAAVLSGNVVIETSFFDAKQFLCKNVVRVYYV